MIYRDLLCPQPSIHVFQNIPCSCMTFIEARSVDQDKFISIQSCIGRAYGVDLGFQSVVGPARVCKTVDKLPVPVQAMQRDGNQGIVLDSCRNHMAQQICINALTSMNIKDLRYSYTIIFLLFALLIDPPMAERHFKLRYVVVGIEICCAHVCVVLTTLQWIEQ